MKIHTYNSTYNYEKNKMHVCGSAFVLENVMFNFRTNVCIWWIFLLLNLHPKSIYLVFVWNQIINHYTTSGIRKKNCERVQ